MSAIKRENGCLEGAEGSRSEELSAAVKTKKKKKKERKREEEDAALHWSLNSLADEGFANFRPNHPPAAPLMAHISASE